VSGTRHAGGAIAPSTTAGRIVLFLIVLAIGSVPFAGIQAEEEPGGGRNPVNDAVTMVRHVVSDALHVTAAPTRMRRGDVYRLGVFLAATGMLYTVDEQGSDFLRRNRDAAVYSSVLDIGDYLEPVGLTGTTTPYYMAGGLIGYALGLERLRVVSFQILEPELFTGVSKRFANRVVGRHRPFEGRGPYSYEFRDGTSFPSGHTSSVFVIATVLSHHVDRRAFTVVSYGLAGSVALQRVASRLHWPTDILVGAVAGTVVARSVIRRHEGRSSRVTLAPATRGLGLLCRTTF